MNLLYEAHEVLSILIFFVYLREKRAEIIKKNYHMEFENITKEIIGAAIEVHNHLGPGLLESAYEECLVYELLQKGYKY